MRKPFKVRENCELFYDISVPKSLETGGLLLLRARNPKREIKYKSMGRVETKCEFQSSSFLA